MKLGRIYDVVIIGGGPAGGQCARELSALGVKTALVEKSQNFSENNYSSGGALSSILDEFQLPVEMVGRFWSKIRLISSNESYEWNGGEKVGAVLDFPSLLNFLLREAEKNGCDSFMGYRLVDFEMKRNSVALTFQKNPQETISFDTNVLVDATGYSRAVLSQFTKERQSVFEGIGLEYHVRARDSELPADELQFFLGSKWMPHGYGWIFPMDSFYKVGVAEYVGPGRHQGSLKPFIENILKGHCGITDYQVLDAHGGRLQYFHGRRTAHFYQRIIGIGDAVSTVNPLGWEGIIHAMRSARMAVPYIQQYLQGKRTAFSAYEKNMRWKFDRKWELSRRFAEFVYLKCDDRTLDAGLKKISQLPFDTILDVLFRYDFKAVFHFVTQALRQNFIKYLVKFWRLLF